MAEKKVIVVGGGLAGLSAAMKLAEKGCHVQIVSVTKVKRSHSVCAQGGINAAINLMGEDDSPIIHAYDTIKGGDFLANQAPVLEMCLCALSTELLRATLIFVGLEGPCTIERLFVELPQVSSCCILLMSR